MSVKAIFIGMPGSGKTTLGRLTARALNVPFADSDELIVDRAGESIADIFAHHGEDYFRSLESEVICEALESFDGVLSLGGGAVVHPVTRQALTHHPVVLIEADDAEIIRRLQDSRTVRPLLADNPREKLPQLRREREELYRSCARYVVASSALPPSHTVQKVLDKLQFPEEKE